jgi:hypothetical protein
MSDAVSNKVRLQRHSERSTARSWPEKLNVSGKIKAGLIRLENLINKH